MKKEVYRIEIPIETVDKYSDGLKKADKDIKDFEKTAKGASKGIENFGGSARKAEGDVSKFQGGMRGTIRIMKEATARKWNITVNAVDKASRVISGVNSLVQRVAGRSYRFTIRAVDMASRAIRGIGRMITSIPAMITIGLTVLGVGKLKDATVGAAMSFEGYETSMTHWLDGNVGKAKELVGWMGQFADTTPFSSVDLFPALTQGVGISGGNVPEAQRMLKIAADMAALTPGRSVEDAMNALGGAQMGNFEMMKGFGMRILKEDYDNMGGWEGFLNESATRFEDGAVKLSKTSEGILATLRGYRSSIFRSLGEGILEPMKPRLDSIDKWLENNQETWGRWKDTVKGAGKQASEWAFSKLETGFNHIKSNYLENDEFKSLSFEGKVAFVMDDIDGWWQSKGKPALSGWWESTGQPFIADMGLMIGKGLATGIKTGIKEGLSTVAKLWENVGETAEEHGVFSKETASSAGGAAIASGGALAVGAMILSPILKVLKMPIDATKWIMDKIPNGKSGGKTTVVTDKKKSSGEQTKEKTKSKIYNERLKEHQQGKSGDTKALKPKKFPKMSKMLRGGRGLPVIGALLSGLSLLTSSKEEMPGTGGAIAGGAGGAAAGAAIGSVIPVLGTAIGGIIGGILGSLGGGAIGDWIGINWDNIKGKASETANWIGDKFGVAKEAVSSTLFNASWWSDKWDDVKSWGAEKLSNTQEWWSGILQTASDTLFSAGWWAEKVGFIYGYLESTLFSGEWWAGHWEAVKEVTAGTIFDPSWWSGKWEETKSWASEKWSNAAEIWENAKATIGETLFSSEWWAGHWDLVMGWTAEKWSTAVEIWEEVKNGINETIFSGDWWGEKWDGVKSWTSEKWSSFTTIWDSVLSSISSTLFSSEWWNGKWTMVKGWATSAWASITSGFDVGKEAGKQAATKPGTSTKAYANGGFINKPHLGLVGEAGPEMIIPLSPGRKGRAMDLYQQAGQMLGVKPYANGGLAGQSPSSGRNNNVIDFFGRTGIQPQVYNEKLNVEPMVSTSPRNEASGSTGGVVVHQQIDVKPNINVVVEASSDGSIDVSAISDALVDEIGVKLAGKIEEAKGNMFITAS